MRGLGHAALRGMVAGLAGAGVMPAGEKLEQRVTARPSSYVPGGTLAALVGLDRLDRDRLARNLAMHYTTGALCSPPACPRSKPSASPAPRSRRSGISRPQGQRPRAPA